MESSIGGWTTLSTRFLLKRARMISESMIHPSTELWHWDKAFELIDLLYLELVVGSKCYWEYIPEIETIFRGLHIVDPSGCQHQSQRSICGQFAARMTFWYPFNWPIIMWAHSTLDLEKYCTSVRLNSKSNSTLEPEEHFYWLAMWGWYDIPCNIWLLISYICTVHQK